MHTPKYKEHTRQQIVGFTRVMAGAFAIIAGALFYSRGYELDNLIRGLLIGSGLWLIAGAAAPIVLKPLYHAWMWLAYCMNFVMTRVILGALFFAVMLPISILMRIAGRDPLQKKLTEKSMWHRRHPAPRNHFEELYTKEGVPRAEPGSEAQGALRQRAI